jgi:hypothetical protein
VKELEPGHQFLIDFYDSEPGDTDELTFMKRVGEGYPGNEGFPHGGTNCQEVLRALIRRTLYLNGQISCPQSIRIIEQLRNALYLFEYRAAERKDKLKEFFRMPNIRSDLVGIEDIPTCPKCGHIFPHTHEMEDAVDKG